MQYPEIISIPNNPALRGQAGVVPDVVYSTATGQDLTLTLLMPWAVEGAPLPRRPLRSLRPRHPTGSSPNPKA